MLFSNVDNKGMPPTLFEIFVSDLDKRYKKDIKKI